MLNSHTTDTPFSLYVLHAFRRFPTRMALFLHIHYARTHILQHGCVGIIFTLSSTCFCITKATQVINPLYQNHHPEV